MVGVGVATLADSSPAGSVAAPDDAEVLVPEDEELQEADDRQVPRPQVACERAGVPVDCVAWMRRLAPAGLPHAPNVEWVEATPDRVVVQRVGGLVALSRATGHVAWRTDPAAGMSLVGRPWMVSGGVIAGGTEQGVHALSLDDGREQWAVEQASLAGTAWGGRPQAIHTVRVVDGRSVLAAHDAEGAVRWTHTFAEADQVRHRHALHETGPLVFVVASGPEHQLQTTALSRDDGRERWRRTDSRPLHATDGTAVMLDVDRDVRGEDGGVTISESPATLLGLDATDGTERWRYDIAANHVMWEIVDDVLLVRDDDGLTGVDLATGEQLWNQDVAEDEWLLRAATFERATGHDRHLVSFVDGDRRVVARDPATGETLWQTSLEQHVQGVRIVDGEVVARVNGTTVVLIDPATGEVRGTVTMDGEPELVASDVLVDRDAGWAVGLDLTGDGS